MQSPASPSPSDLEGSGTLYLIGPGQVIKREFKSGSVQIKGEELRSAGRWIAIVRRQPVSGFLGKTRQAGEA